jgi:hypothetical protein
MKTILCRVFGLLVVVTAAFSTACSSPSAVNPPDARAYSDQWGHQPDEPFPSYSYKRVGGG